MAYTRVNWQNGSGGGTPVNSTNLNVMDAALEDQDARITDLEGSASDAGTAALIEDEESATRTALDALIAAQVAATVGANAHWTGTSWTARPDVDTPVTWWSTNDWEAPEPDDMVQDLDVWIQHPWAITGPPEDV